MRCSETLILALIVIGMAGCDTLRVNVQHDYDFDFAPLQTFAWTPTPTTKMGRQQAIADDPLLDSRIRSLVESQLFERGYIKKAGGTPDFYVGYFAAAMDRVDVVAVNEYYGYAPYAYRGNTWGQSYGRGTRTYVDRYQEGTLIVDISIPETKKLIWRGTAQAELDEYESQQASDDRLAKAVSRMFEHFPPQ